MLQPPHTAPVVIKKYGNRRLYDTRSSRYVTLHELVDVIEKGADIRVVDAKTGEDLTQATLVQIIMDGRGAARLLPVSLLTQLVRMRDDALAEFLGRYMTYALELYLQARQGARSLAPWNPFASLPFTAASDVARFFGGPGHVEQPRSSPVPSGAVQQEEGELAALRREIADLRDAVGRRPRASRKRKRPSR